MDTIKILNRANEAFSKNFFKSLLSLVVFSVLTILLTYFIIVGFFTAAGSVTLFFGFLLVIWFYVIFYTLQYGLMVTVFKMTAKEKTVLGHLFTGFKNFKQVAGAALLTFAGMFLLNLVILTPYTLFDSSFSPLFTYSMVPQGVDLEVGITALFLITMSVYIIALLFFSIIFSFIPYIFEQNPHIKVLRAYKGCLVLLKGRIIHFIVCTVRGVWPFLLVELGALILTGVNMANPLPSLLMKLTSFAHTISANLLLLKTYFV
ncbi:MAG TPA: hypothetical protein PLR39_10730, partial [Treponemataceae bacterium]|nr:hypothetical protein [Treponemataceae bacterium]